MPALSTDSPTPSDAALTPIERARAAAEARAQRPPPSSGPPVSTSEQAHSPLLQPQDFNPSRADVLPFHRLLDSEVSLTSSSRPTLKRELTLSPPLSCSRSAPSRKRSRLSIRSPPSSPTSPNPLTASKFRQIRLSNALIRSTIVEVAGAQDYLIASGFRSQNVEFTPYLVFSPSPTPAQLHKLRVAHHVIGLKLGSAREVEEREKRHRDAEKEAEAGAFSSSSPISPRSRYLEATLESYTELVSS
jgi:hypothetical protein